MEKFHEQKVFYFRFYILCENFSKIGPIIKIIQNFVNDPLKTQKGYRLMRNESVKINGKMLNFRPLRDHIAL